MASEKIAVIGSSGFIGSSVSRYLMTAGKDVVPFVRNVKRLQSDINWKSDCHLACMLVAGGYDTIINCAGSPGVSHSYEEPFEDYLANVELLKNITDVFINSPDIDPPQLIHLSSAAVYGQPSTLPIPESEPCLPMSPYGVHKQMSELLCMRYHMLTKASTAILRAFSVYGPGQRKLLLWDAVNKFNSQQPVVFWGTGDEVRDFIHVDDLSRAIHCVLNARENIQFENFNCGSGVGTTIREIVQNISEAFEGRRYEFSGEGRQGNPTRWVADISKLQQLGFEATVNISEGVKDYVRSSLPLVRA